MVATSENLGNFLKIQIPELVPRLLDSKCLGGGINVLWWFGHSARFGGREGCWVALSTFYRLLLSSQQYFLILCFHTSVPMLPSLSLIWLQCIIFSWFCHRLLTFPSASYHNNISDQSTQSLSLRSHNFLHTQFSLLFWFGFIPPHNCQHHISSRLHSSSLSWGISWFSSLPLPQIIELLFALLRISSHLSCSQSTHLCLNSSI